MVKMILSVDGMMCPMCEAHMNDAIRREFKVKSVSSSHAKKTVEIVCAEALDEEKLRATVTGLGYDLLGVSLEAYEKKSFFSRLGKK